MIFTETRSTAYMPGQRFKRMDRIVDKLRRYPHMRHSQMEDIGGCRAILPDLDTVYAVTERIQRRWRASARYRLHRRPEARRLPRNPRR
jgi:ppGpp synthetase/RelA/SpoT-type nucleotidyltranferase